MIRADSLILLDTNIVVNLVSWSAMGQRIDSDRDLRGRRDRQLVSMVTAGELDSLARKLNWAEKNGNTCKSCCWSSCWSQ